MKKILVLIISVATFNGAIALQDTPESGFEGARIGGTITSSVKSVLKEVKGSWVPGKGITTRWYNEKGELVGQDTKSIFGRPLSTMRQGQIQGSVPVITTSSSKLGEEGQFAKIGDVEATVINNKLTLRTPTGTSFGNLSPSGKTMLRDPNAEVTVINGELSLRTPEGSITSRNQTKGLFSALRDWWHSR